MNINIKIEKETRKVWADKYTIGNDGENLQCNLVFTFDEFVDGQAILFYEIDDESRFDYLEKVDEQYILPIKSTLTKQGTIPMQLVITEGIEENEVPIFKTNIFKVNIGSSIEDGIEQPEEYPSWLEIANTKLNQVDNLDIDITTEDDVTKVKIKRKDGTEKEATVSGATGAITDVIVDEKSVVDGGIAKINLSKKVDKVDGKGLSTNDFTKEDKEKLNSLSNYDDTKIKEELANKQPKGNYLTSIPSDYAKKTDIPNVSNFITKEVTDLTNYYDKKSIDNIVGNIESLLSEV